MQTELTPTIAEMSEVVAKYINWDYTKGSDTSFPYWTNNQDKSCICFNDFPDWNVLHEVWEKVLQDDNLKYLDKGISIINTTENAILSNNKLEALTDLYNCIIFINQFKTTRK